MKSVKILVRDLVELMLTAMFEIILQYAHVKTDILGIHFLDVA
jgi:hypothetical protein